MLAAVLLGSTKQSTHLHLPSSENGSTFRSILRVTCKNHPPLVFLLTHASHMTHCVLLMRPPPECIPNGTPSYNGRTTLSGLSHSCPLNEWIIHRFLIIFLASPFTLCSLFSLQWPKRLWKVSQIREEGTLPTIWVSHQDKKQMSQPGPESSACTLPWV